MEALRSKTSKATQDWLKTSYPVMEHFYTLQGEGFFQGHAAYFVRLGGCDVGCSWCDVKESWPINAHPEMTVDEIVHSIAATPAQTAVITGGEPLMHNCTDLTTALQQLGINTHIETSGAWPLSGSWNWVCLSPKKFKPALPEVIRVADELKIIVYNRDDFRWAEQYAAQVPEGCKLFLQPEWSRESKMLPLIIEYVQQHPQWVVSLQLHKYMNIP